MGLAWKEALRFNHAYIGTEHMLLGLTLEGDGIAASVFRDLDIDLESVCSEIAGLMTRGTGRIAKDSSLPFTPRAKTVLERSLEEAETLGHAHIGTEHLLLALARETDGIAAEALRNLNVKPEDVRREVSDLVRNASDAR